MTPFVTYESFRAEIDDRHSGDMGLERRFIYDSHKLRGQFPQNSHRNIPQSLDVKHISFALAGRFHMKRNKIVTATILSAGLILGATSSAFATDSTPTATVTTASYNSQVAAYNSSLIAFDSATATFKIQIAAYSTAVQVYKTSYNNALETYKAILKANSPATTAAQYAALVAAYNAAMTAYTTATVTFKAQLSVYQAAALAYNNAYKAVYQGYKTTLEMREQLKKSINVAFDLAVHNANVAFATAMSTATTDAQKTAATNARQGAIVTAIATRKAALDTLGAKIVKPSKVEIKISVKEDGFKFDRPVRPIRPDHVEKSKKSANH